MNQSNTISLGWRIYPFKIERSIRSSVFCALLLVRERRACLFLGCHFPVSSTHGDLSLRQSFDTHRELELRRESNSSLPPEQSLAEAGESRCLSSPTEVVPRWKSNSSLGRSRSMSAVERSVHREPTFARWRETRLRTTHAPVPLPHPRSVEQHFPRARAGELSLRSEILNVSGNNLDSLVELSSLERLQELTASNNNLENLRELVQLITVWPRLKRLDTSRNPMCSKARYRERLIVVSSTLGNWSSLASSGSLLISVGRNARRKTDHREFPPVPDELESLAWSPADPREVSSGLQRLRERSRW